MISLKFLEIELNLKNVYIENIGLLGVFVLKALKDDLTIKEISEVTRFNLELIQEEIKYLQKRGFIKEGLTKRGEYVLSVYDFIQKVNNFSIVIDTYFEEKLFILNKERLNQKALFPVYPSRLYDYGIYKKINNFKKEILGRFTDDLRLNFDEFELNYTPKKVYYKDFKEIILGGDRFKIGEKVYEVKQNIEYINDKKIEKRVYYFSLFNKEIYKNITEFNAKVFLPKKYNLSDVECKIEVGCLVNINTIIKEKINTKFIDIEKMLEGIK